MSRIVEGIKDLSYLKAEYIETDDDQYFIIETFPLTLQDGIKFHKLLFEDSLSTSDGLTFDELIE